MSSLVHASEPPSPSESAPVRSPVAQRCPCGGMVAYGGECAQCRRKRLARQAALGGPPERQVSTAPSGGFSHDFARVSLTPVFAGAGAGNEPHGAVATEPATEAQVGPEAEPTPEATREPAAEPAAPETPTAETEDEAAAPAAAPALSWTHVKSHTWDALWFFCGEHPSGFSTTVLLRAGGYGDPTALTWSITRGSDKVAFVGAPTGAEVRVTSRAGSTRPDDVAIEVREGAVVGAASYEGTLTVRKPRRLLQRFVRHHPNCPPAFPTCPAACPAHWTEIGYRVVDNVGGSIVGATVNENFPSSKVNDQANNWVSPAAFATVPVWPNTNGTFIDFWWVACGNPSPVNPGTANAGNSVDRLTHEFYVGSRTSGRGCRVQTHTAHRYLGHTLHENIVTPAP